MTDSTHGTERILIVEDSDGARRLAMLMLTSLGYSVSEVANAEAAIEILATQTFDLMFSDIALPDPGSGIDLARLATKHYPSMKILLTSGYPPDSEELAKLGAFFIGKPFRKLELALELRDILASETSIHE